MPIFSGLAKYSFIEEETAAARGVKTAARAGSLSSVGARGAAIDKIR